MTARIECSGDLMGGGIYKRISPCIGLGSSSDKLARLHLIY